MGSATKAEVGAPFHNGQELENICITLNKMSHRQLATPMQTDNYIANGISNNTVRQKHSKSMDMRFYWIRDRIKQYHFHVFCKPGMANLWYYFTKNHPLHNHREMRPIYFHTEATVEKSSARVFSLLTATSKLGDYNTKSIPEYEVNINPKAQSTQR